MQRKQNIVVASLKYSDNLGDGLIADCFANLIGQDCVFREFDFSGRLGIGDGATRRAAILPMLHSMPSIVSSALVRFNWAVRKRAVVMRAIPHPLGPDELIVFCGGQILSDVHLNFPLKLSYIADRCEESGAGFAFYGVGVGAKWSRHGAALIERVLRSPMLCGLSVRDPVAARLAKTLFDIDAAIAPDAALFAKETYNVIDMPARDVVGIGVADPCELSSALDGWALDENTVRKELVWLVQELAIRGRATRLFTNGASEDEAFLDRVVSDLEQCRVPFERAARPTTPKDLVEILAGLGSIIAFRLHALIGACALGKPFVALLWDEKVKGFLELVERSSLAVAPIPGFHKTVMEKLNEATPIGPARLLRFKMQARDQVDRLLNSANL